MCRNRSVVLTLTLTTLFLIAATARAEEDAADSNAADAPAQEPTTAPTTAPTTGPTTAEALPLPDQTTPKGAVKVLFMSLEAGDVVKITAALHAANPAEERMVKAIAEMSNSLSRMRQAAIAAFGIEGARGLAGDPGMLANGLAQVEAAEEKIAGDSATLQMGDPQDTPGGGMLKVSRVAGEWRVPMAELSKGRNPDDIEKNLQAAQIQKDVVDDITTELSAGKFKTADDAVDAWKARMMQAAMQQAQPPATQQAPADAPTTAPAEQQP